MLRRRGPFRMRFSMRNALALVIFGGGSLILTFLIYTTKARSADADVDVRNFNQGLLNINEDADEVWQARNDRLITCQLHGRIGNMMFAYASMVGIARHNARTPALPAGHFLRALFRLKAADLPQKVSSREKVIEQKAGVYDDRMEWINSDAGLIELIGYFQSWKYFARVIDEVRHEFVFNADFRRDAKKFIDGAVAEKFGSGVGWRDVVVVGIHVRVRDMMSNASIAQGYTIASPSYLSAAMDYFKHEFQNDKLLFVLATDDLEWCDRNFPFPEKTPLVKTSKGPDALDLAILSSCNHTIITVGTFGWWAGWLAGGRTVYYKNFPSPQSSLATLYKSDDYYPASWIAM